MYRFFTALFVLVCLTVSCAALADECMPKDKFRAALEVKYDKLVHMDINGEHDEKMFLANLSKLSGKDLSGSDAVIYRNPGFKTTLVMLFKDGCAVLQAEFPNEAITPLLGRDA